MSDTFQWTDELVNEYVDQVGRVDALTVEAFKESKTNPRTPVMKTEDGVDLYEGDEVWWIDSLDLTFINSTTVKKNPFNKAFSVNKYFSTEKKAQEFIIENKPVLRVKDVLDILDESIISQVQTLAIGREITNLAKSIIQK